MGEVVPPLSITPVEPKDLHQWWPIVERGIECIIRKLGHQNVDFIPEDVFSGIRTGGCVLYLVQRDQRSLGFFICYPQQRPFSGRKELFLWLVWDLPLKDQRPEDDMPAVTMAVRDYLVDLALKLGCDSISALSTRRGFEKWNFKPGVINWRLWLNRP